jgi:para-aminobenzoate synthetase component 1
MPGIVIPLSYPCAQAPLKAFAAFAGQDGAVFLDSAADAGGRGRWSYLCVAPRLRLTDSADPFATLDRLAALIPQGPLPWPDGKCAPPFQGGVVGWLSYEAGRHLERLPQAPADDLGVPEVAFGLYDVIAAFDTVKRRAWVIGQAGSEAKAKHLAHRLQQHIAAGDLPRACEQGFSLEAEQSRAQAEAAVARVIEAIYCGDIFQANVTQRLSGALPPALGVWDLYRRLRAESAAPFAAMASFGGAHLLSASPERFLAVNSRGWVESRPIKGTRPRGRTIESDRALGQELLASEKDQAENLMIVDLLRNDLSRVCRVGSVQVPSLCRLETFASVHHLVSVVTGHLRAGENARSLLRAAFPGGSITGAPKIHAMEILSALEPCRRGLYCGSLFWLGGDGAFDSSILIRSLVVGRTGRVAAQAGGGIVADSDPAAEWQEAMTKVAPLVRAAAGTPGEADQ